MIFFRKGDKDLGIRQLEKASREAFYTRVEAMTFMMKIYGDFEGNKNKEAIDMALYLHQLYPNNPYFEMHYAKYCYRTGRLTTCLKVSKDILEKHEAKKQGYGQQNARYASYFSGYIELTSRKDSTAAYSHFTKCAALSEELEFEERAYYRKSLDYLATIALSKNEKEKAKEYYEKIKEHSDHDTEEYDKAKKFLKEYYKGTKRRRRRR